MKRILTTTAALILTAAAAQAEGISTHVLDLARGVGGQGVPVVLERADGDGWTEVGTGTTQDNGRVEDFGGDIEEGVHRLTFGLQGYEGFENGEPPFFPQITVQFDVDDAAQHYHVPIVMSPYGYSTYRGN